MASRCWRQVPHVEVEVLSSTFDEGLTRARLRSFIRRPDADSPDVAWEACTDWWERRRTSLKTLDAPRVPSPMERTAVRDCLVDHAEQLEAEAGVPRGDRAFEAQLRTAG